MVGSSSVEAIGRAGDDVITENGRRGEINFVCFEVKHIHK